MQNVMIVDYGMGNLFSVKRAFEKCGAKVTIVEDPNLIFEASHIVLPGVGAYKDGMGSLKKKQWDIALKQAVFEYNIPLLGICLGMQLLADKGYEGEETAGLGLIEGEVIKLSGITPNEKIPHVGWNEIMRVKNSELLHEIEDNTDYYFVHSYHFITNENNIIAKTPYCKEFNSIVGKENIYGVQFHPEKSSKAGFKIISNFLEIL